MFLSLFYLSLTELYNVLFVFHYEHYKSINSCCQQNSHIILCDRSTDSCVFPRIFNNTLLFLLFYIIIEENKRFLNAGCFKSRFTVNSKLQL